MAIIRGNLGRDFLQESEGAESVERRAKSRERRSTTCVGTKTAESGDQVGRTNRDESSENQPETGSRYCACRRLRRSYGRT